jgi:regulator of sigma E protease
MLVARLSGMRVDRFSVGFGPSLVQWRGRKTIYQIALVPLGGFVQIAGMNPQDKLAPDDAGSYASKGPGARFATILAGPATNYLCSMVIMVGVMLAFGLPRWQQVVAEVAAASPAAQSGLRSGDSILAVDGRSVSAAGEIIETIGNSKGRTLTLMVARGTDKVPLKVTPRAEEDTYRIGIQFGRKLSFSPLAGGKAVLLGLLYPFDQTHGVLSGLGQLFSGRVSVKQVGGPLEIVRQLKISFEESFALALIFLAMLNVYLGLFNLFPIPALDGGRLVFLSYTILTGRSVNQRVENAIHTVGFVLLLGLILLITYGDVARLLGMR